VSSCCGAFLSGGRSPCRSFTKASALDAGYRLDLAADERVILEVKAVEALAPIHDAQLLTYLRLSGMRLGFLMNFHVALFKQGLKRMVL